MTTTRDMENGLAIALLASGRRRTSIQIAYPDQKNSLVPQDDCTSPIVDNAIILAASTSPHNQFTYMFYSASVDSAVEALVVPLSPEVVGTICVGLVWDGIAAGLKTH